MDGFTIGGIACFTIGWFVICIAVVAIIIFVMRGYGKVYKAALKRSEYTEAMSIALLGIKQILQEALDYEREASNGPKPMPHVPKEVQNEQPELEWDKKWRKEILERVFYCRSIEFEKYIEAINIVYDQNETGESIKLNGFEGGSRIESSESWVYAAIAKTHFTGLGFPIRKEDGRILLLIIRRDNNLMCPDTSKFRVSLWDCEEIGEPGDVGYHIPVQLNGEMSLLYISANLLAYFIDLTKASECLVFSSGMEPAIIKIYTS